VDSRPHDIDIGSLLPHSALQVLLHWAAGARVSTPGRPSTFLMVPIWRA